MLTRTFECVAIAATVALGLGLSGPGLADDAGQMTRQTFLELTGTPVEEVATWAPIVTVAEVQYETYELAECGELITFGPLTGEQLAARAAMEAEHAELQAKIEAAKALEPWVWSYEQEVPSTEWH